MMLKARELIKDEKIYYPNKFIENPKVSIIMPTYCRGDNGLLIKAIDSVLNQTYIFFELIIVDDGSVDNTQNLVKEYQKKDNRILYIRNDVNSGLPALRANQGIMHSRGMYISYMFDDDSWRPNALKALVDEIETETRLAVIYGGCMMHFSGMDRSTLLKNEFEYYKLIENNLIANNAVIHHKKICEIYGMYDMHLTMRRLNDWDLWLRWGKHVSFRLIDEVISDANVGENGSLGTTCKFDLQITREMLGRDRDKALCLDRFLEYDIDDISFIENEKEKEYVYSTHILPWKLKHREFYLDDRNIYTLNGHKTRIIATKTTFDATVTLNVESYLEFCKDEYTYLYIPEEQLPNTKFYDGDILALNRATLLSTLNLVRNLRDKKIDVTVVYFIDDDLLKIYQVGDTYAAPGTLMYGVICDLISASDRIVTFSKSIADSIRGFNDRITILQTHVNSSYLSKHDSYEEHGAFRILFAGGGARVGEFKAISRDLVKLSERYEDKIEFDFWGYIPDEIKNITTSKVRFIPFTSSYTEYMDRLSASKYNLFLCPLDDSEFKRGKSPIKFLEMCCCSTIGLFSDMPVYSLVEDGVNGFKIKAGESWYNKIVSIIEMPVEDKKRIFNAALETAATYTTELSIDKFRLALKAAQLYNRIGSKTILYACHSPFLGGAENHLFRHAMLAKNMGFKVEFALPIASETMNESLQLLLKSNGIETSYYDYLIYGDIEDIDFDLSRIHGEGLSEKLAGKNIGLIHNCTMMPAFSYAAKRLGIPQVSSIYQSVRENSIASISDEFKPTVIHSDSVLFTNVWFERFDVYSTCIRSHVPDTFFINHKTAPKPQYHIAVSGTVQRRKGQLEAIKAVGILKEKYDIALHLYGYTRFFPEYIDECKLAAKSYGIEDKVYFEDFVSDIRDAFIKDDIDMLVCASTSESFPQVVLEAMAMEIPVVSTPVAGVPELLNIHTGYLAVDFSEEDIAGAIENCIKSIIEGTASDTVKRAKEQISKECSFENVSCRLFDLYSRAINSNSASHIQKFGSEHAYSIPDNSVSILPAQQNVRISKTIENSYICYSRGIRKSRTYRIFCEYNTLSAIKLILASDAICKGNIRVSIYSSGLCLRSTTIPIDARTYHKWTSFTFDRLYNCGGHILTVKVEVFYEEGSGKVGVFEDTRRRSLWYRVMKKLGLPTKRLNVLYFDCEE